MTPRFDVYTMGYKAKGQLASWAAVILATASDGRIKEKVISGVLGGMTKNQADITAVTKALQCVKPEYRASALVALHGPPGYAAQMIERGYDGLWKFNPTMNREFVDSARKMVDKYTKLDIRRIESGPLYRRCIELAQAVLVPQAEGIANV